MAKVLRDPELLHPILRAHIEHIQREVIERHSLPFRLFETGRTRERQADLVEKRRARTLVSRQFFDLDRDPPLYATGFNFVYFSQRWSWDVRNRTIVAWYQILGELSLDLVPDLEWAGYWRSCSDYTFFQLRHSVLVREGIVIPERERVDSRVIGKRSSSETPEVTERRASLA